MEANMTMQMKQNIDRLSCDGNFDNKRVVVFGSNQAAEEMVDYLLEKSVKVDMLVDNSEKKIGSSMKGIDIASPEEYLRPFQDNTIVLIASKYYAEMTLQLKAMGYEEGVHIRKIVEYTGHSSSSLSDEEFDKRFEIVKQGEICYNKILNSYPDIEKIFACPLTILGDTYVSVACIHDYVKKENINDYLILVVSKPCYKVVSLFGFENIMQITPSEMGALVQFSIFADKANKEIINLHHRVPYTCGIGNIGNYRDVSFMDHFRYSMFGLPEGTLPEKPKGFRGTKESEEYVKALFKDNDLRYGKTAILIPYANTLSQVPVGIWEKITEKLLDLGYTVCTNCDGDSQPPIKGTKALFFDLRYGLETLEAAGLLIGLRCGLCDVLSTADCRKIILYPDRIYGPDTFMKFFSIKGMQLAEDVEEYLLCDEQEWFG